ncbi:hypothetical protein ACVIGB_003011 [Bradyrhizobium sp. USDA 4341]
MANTPKKVKDPTEVALSAIQEALNISEQGAESRSPLNEGAAPLSLPPSAPDFFSRIVRVPLEYRSFGVRADRGTARAAPRRQ